MEQPTEEQARALRDFVFGVPTTDNNWEHCKDKWMMPDTCKWLMDTTEVIKARRAKGAYG